MTTVCDKGTSMADDVNDYLCTSKVDNVHEPRMQSKELEDQIDEMDTYSNDTTDTSKTLKRQNSSSSRYEEIDLIASDEKFTIVQHKDRKKQQRTDNKGKIQTDQDKIIQGNQQITSSDNSKINSRIVNNSSIKNNNRRIDPYSNNTSQTNTISQQYQQEERQNLPRQDESSVNNRNERNLPSADTSNNMSSVNQVHISKHALSYAVNEQLPPLHIICTPRINNHQDGAKLVNALIGFIEKDFQEKNKDYKLPLAFDYWFHCKNGNLVCFTKHIEVFVYLCDQNNQPKTLNSIDINFAKPRHFPHKHTLIMKYVTNEISLEEVRNAIEI